MLQETQTGLLLSLMTAWCLKYVYKEDCICVYKFSKQIGPFEYKVLKRNRFIPYPLNSIY